MIFLTDEIHEIIHSHRMLLDARIENGVGAYIHYLDFAREYGTLALNFGRQCGHTTSIIKYKKPNDLIFVPNKQNKQNVESMLKTEFFDSGMNDSIFGDVTINFDKQLINATQMWSSFHTVSSILEQSRSVDRHTVWIDTASFYGMHVLDKIYQETANPNGSTQFVLLG